MPKVDVFSAFKESDKLSQNIRQLQNNVKGLTKDINEYRKVANKAFDKRKEIKLDITKAKSELKELEKSYKNGDKTAEKSFKNKQKYLNLLNEEYKRLGNIIKETEDNQKIAFNDITNNELFDMSKNSVAGLGKQAISSTYGSETADTVSDFVGSAFAGAKAGAAIPVIGAPLGTAIGLLTASINLLTKHIAKKDESFRNEVQNIYSLVQDDKLQGLENGKSLFLEKDKVVNQLSSLLGSKEKGNDFYDKINQFSIDSPYKTENLLELSKSMLSNNVSEDKIYEGFNLIGNIAAGDSSKFAEMAEAFSKIQSDGKLSGEYAEQLSNRNFDILTVLAEKDDISVDEMSNRMDAGLISSADVIDALKIATSEGGNYHNAMDDIMSSYSGTLEKYNALKNDMDTAYAEGYAKQKQIGMESAIEEYGGEYGEEMKEAHNLIGQFEADLENRHEEAVIKAIKEAKENDDYQKALAEDNGAEMGRILAAAKAKAETDFMNSNEYKLKAEADIKLINDVQKAVKENGAYLKYGEEMAKQFSKGFYSVINEKYFEDLMENPPPTGFEVKDYKSLGCGNATGLRRVPFDNMPALLHEGERVLTRLEADNLDRIKNKPPTNITLQVSANTSNPYQLAQILYSELKNAMENYGGA